MSSWARRDPGEVRWSEDCSLPCFSIVHAFDSYSFAVPQSLGTDDKHYIAIRIYPNFFEAWFTLTQEIIVAAVHVSTRFAVVWLLGRINEALRKRSGIPPSKVAAGIEAYVYTVPDPNQGAIINNKVVVVFTFGQFGSTLGTNRTSVSKRNPSRILCLVCGGVPGLCRGALDTKYLPGVVERQILEIPNKLESELGALIHHDLVEFSRARATGEKKHNRKHPACQPVQPSY